MHVLAGNCARSSGGTRGIRCGSPFEVARLAAVVFSLAAGLANAQLWGKSDVDAAWDAEQAGEFDKADTLYRKAVEAAEKAGGEIPLKALDGVVREAMRRRDVGTEATMRCGQLNASLRAAMYEAMYAPYWRTVADFWFLAGKYDSAELAYLKLLVAQTTTWGHGSPDLEIAKILLARCQWHRHGKRQLSEAQAIMSLTLAGEKLSTDSFAMFRVLDAAVALFIDTGNHADAEKYCGDVLRAFEAANGKESEHNLPVLRLMETLYKLRGDGGKLQEVTDRIQRISRKQAPLPTH